MYNDVKKRKQRKEVAYAKAENGGCGYASVSAA